MIQNDFSKINGREVVVRGKSILLQRMEKLPEKFRQRKEYRHTYAGIYDKSVRLYQREEK